MVLRLDALPPPDVPRLRPPARRRPRRRSDRRSGATGQPAGDLDANGQPTGLVWADPTFTAQADTPEGPTVELIGAHCLYVGGNFQEVSDTPGANFRSQPGFAEYPAIG